ncbi:MAG TPA: family 78 glycoside hydrolase catalytic domain [Acidimicrobiales bacterium]|nr:family 78 glycoside hydrolase catalytic domain [Acidimicrobiales bacterium]
MERTDRRTFLVNGVKVTSAAAAAAAVLPTVAAGAAEGSVDPVRTGSSSGAGRPTGLTVNGLEEPVGVDPDDLSFAWTLTDRRRGARQSAYRVVVRRTGTAETVWDSGRVSSARQAFVPYGGPSLDADTRYVWTVATADGTGTFGPFAPARPFRTGLREKDWRAVWLGTGPSTSFVYTYLRREFTLTSSPLTAATAYVAGAHKYQLWVNGTLADTGPSYSYPDEQYYQATDLTAHLRAGQRNAVGLLHYWHGEGSGRPASFPGVLAQVSVHHADGRDEVVGTGADWRQRPGEWLPSAVRNGSSNDYVEIIDGRATPLGWSSPGYGDGDWSAVSVLGPVGTAPFTDLYAQRSRIDEHPVAPVSLRTLPSGAVVADFGQILAGRPVVDFHGGVAGRTVNLHVGYLLDQDGHVSTTHGTQGTDLSFTYIQRDGPQTFLPYTFLGFRYLQVDGAGEPLTADDVSMVARHAAMPAVAPATFLSSNETLDRVFALCAHSGLYASHEQFVDTPTRQKGQFLSDSTSESQVIMRTFGDRNLSWQGLRDFARSQARFWPDGRVNDVYPDGNGATDIPDFTELFPEWVWRYYVHTGDTATVEELYPTLRRITDYVWAAVDPTTGLVTNLPGGGSDYQYGLVDWPPQMRYGYDMATAARTTMNVLAVNACNRVAAFADIVGDTTASSTEAARAAALTAAINAHLVNADGLYVDGLEDDGSPSTHVSQQANAFALTYGVVPTESSTGYGVFTSPVAKVGRHVASLGVAMGPDHGLELVRALHAAGMDGAMVKTLTDAGSPGWAYILAHGGTFTWESWTPSDLEGDSMSHGWGSGALVAMQEHLLGIEPLPPGTLPGPPVATHLVVAPPLDAIRHGARSSERLTFASGTAPTTSGPVTLAWRNSALNRNTDRLALSLTLPANSRARLELPAAGPGSVTESGRQVTQATGVSVEDTSVPGVLTLLVDAGSYRFEAVGTAYV